MSHDVFYVSRASINNADWAAFRVRFPLAQKIENVESLDDIKRIAFTKMFWVVWNDVEVAEDFTFDYVVPEWDMKYIHVFKNSEQYDGIAIFSKTATISPREFTHRFYSDKKEIDILASVPKQYDKFCFESYEEYVEAIADPTVTEMFWCIWPETEVTDVSVFDMYFSHHNSYDRKENHVFKNVRNGEETFLGGVILCSKHKPLSKMEIRRRYVINKKEHNQIVSRNAYDRFRIESFEDYEAALKNTKTEMFWCIWAEVNVIDNKVFDLYFDSNNGVYDHDRSENHVFKNIRNGEETFMSGVVLCSKNKPLSAMEIRRRYVIDKKEHDRVVSRNAYEQFRIASYDDYEAALKNTKTEMFWCIWDEVNVINDKVFDLYFDSNNGVYDHDREENHVFKHVFRGEAQYHGGLVLCSKQKPINKREVDHRYLIERKEHEEIVSELKPYDIVFISYFEDNAEENYEALLKRFPRAKRINKIKGIHNAHIKAAEKCNTDMIWIVDGDAIIKPDFNFDYEVSTYEQDIVHVWRSQNPINDMIYGYGGIKLLPRKLTLNMDTSTADMTTAISKKFKAVADISNVTAFNTDEFSTWKSAFRECVKLASRVITKQKEEETKERLATWCNFGADRTYGEYAISGARAGKVYGATFKDNKEALAKINDFDWLYEKFKDLH